MNVRLTSAACARRRLDGDVDGGLLSVLDGDAEGGLLSTCAEGPSLTSRLSFFLLWMLFAANTGVGTSPYILGEPAAPLSGR